MSRINREIEILNYRDLDVEELERRLETAAATGISLDRYLIDECLASCCYDSCDAYCGTNCSANCSAKNPCELYGCGGGHLIP